MSQLKDTFSKVSTRMHRGIFTVSKGRVLGRAMGMDLVELTTTGRKSGKARHVDHDQQARAGRATPKHATRPADHDDEVVHPDGYGPIGPPRCYAVFGRRPRPRNANISRTTCSAISADWTETSSR